MKLLRQIKSCINLKHTFLILILAGTFISSLTLAQPSKAKSKPKLNTQVFETDTDDQSFSAKVKIVRDINSETEVFFEDKKHPGPYILSETLPSYGLFKARLEKSKKATGPLVKVMLDNDRIKSVEIDENSQPSSPSEKDVIKSLFKK
ncbi:MAG: hypothetical protein AABY64_04870 [Bdellovibrionota bacterium]